MAYHLFLGLRERVSIFLRRVGTILLALSIILWFLATYPHAPVDAIRPAIEYSYAGQLGLFMQPLFAPLGFNWQMCIALIPAMAAREVAVSALATVYAISGDATETTLGPLLAHDWSLPGGTGLSCLVCLRASVFSTIAVESRETNSAVATVFFMAYLFGLASSGSMGNLPCCPVIDILKLRSCTRETPDVAGNHCWFVCDCRYDFSTAPIPAQHNKTIWTVRLLSGLQQTRQ